MFLLSVFVGGVRSCLLSFYINIYNILIVGGYMWFSRVNSIK